MTSTYRLLVVDDDPQMQFFLKEALERQQYIVRVQGSAEEALDTLRDERFDLILMDIQMPEMSGIEATAAIRERERSDGTYTRIVAMTAHAMTGDRERCIEAGMDGYMTKPFNQSVLFDVVENGSTGSAAAMSAALNREELMERLGDDTELLDELIEVFLNDCPTRLTDIRAAVVIVARASGGSLRSGATMTSRMPCDRATASWRSADPGRQCVARRRT